MKNYLYGSIVVAALAFAGSAQAADMRAPVYKAPPPPVPVFSWTGWYIGANVGGAWSESNVHTSTAFVPGGYFLTTDPAAINAVGSRSNNTSGVTGGGQIGYNWQSGAAVFGLEADFGFFDLNHSRSGTAFYPVGPGSFTVNSSVQSDWLFTFRPRLGYAVNNWLFYVTGGLALTELKGNFAFTDTFLASASGSVSDTRVGWTAGVGVEWAFAGPWSMKLEYLHLDFGDISGRANNLVTPLVAFPATVFNHSVDLRSDMVRVGINYRFGGTTLAGGY